MSWLVPGQDKTAFDITTVQAYAECHFLFMFTIALISPIIYARFFVLSFCSSNCVSFHSMPHYILDFVSSKKYSTMGFYLN